MLLTRTLSRNRQGISGGGVARPQLTSMVDMLTILLVFLLKSFSVEGNLVTASDDLVLPESISEEMPRPTLNVEISTWGVMIDGVQVVALNEFSQVDSLLIPELHRELTRIATTIGIDDLENEVMIQCDRRIDFNVVKRVMFTCAEASYSDFSLLVRRGE